MTERFSILDVTLPKEGFDAFETAISAKTGVDLAAYAKSEPHEMYQALVTRLASIPIDLQRVTVDTNPVQSQFKSRGTLHVDVNTAIKELIPDPEVTPIQIIVSVWKKKTWLDVLRRREQGAEAVFNFYTKPMDLAF
jgi:hypothetical protein